MNPTEMSAPRMMEADHGPAAAMMPPSRPSPPLLPPTRARSNSTQPTAGNNNQQVDEYRHWLERQAQRDRNPSFITHPSSETMSRNENPWISANAFQPYCPAKMSTWADAETARLKDRLVNKPTKPWKGGGGPGRQFF